MTNIYYYWENEKIINNLDASLRSAGQTQSPFNGEHIHSVQCKLPEAEESSKLV